jgi:hypothetical protein
MTATLLFPADEAPRFKVRQGDATRLITFWDALILEGLAKRKNEPVDPLDRVKEMLEEGTFYEDEFDENMRLLTSEQEKDYQAFLDEHIRQFADKPGRLQGPLARNASQRKEVQP